LASLPEIRRRIREFDRLSALGDAALARRGLRRETLAQSVFLDGSLF
jgi:hypothetical protein